MGSSCWEKSKVIVLIRCARELEKFAFTRLKQVEADFGGDDADELMNGSSEKR